MTTDDNGIYLREKFTDSLHSALPALSAGFRCVTNRTAVSMKHVGKLRRPLRSQRLLARRKRVLAFGAMLALGAAGALALLFAGCAGGTAMTPPAPPPPSVA